jgi:electron transfer flavoprotein beta subunit
MPLDIMVCIKQVPDPEYFDKITLDPSSGTIRRTGIPVITNPADRHAVEEGLRIRDELGGSVTVLTMGPPLARKSIDEALAMGADRGAVLCDQAFAGADTLSTAYILSGGIQLLGRYDLVLCGNETVDGSTGQVPAQIAEFLNIPHVTCARKMDMIDDHRAIIERVVEGGFLRVELELPAVVAVLKGMNTYRLPTVMGIMEAAQKDVLELGCPACESLGMAPFDMGLKGSPTRVAEVFESPQRRRAEMITGDPADMAKQLIRRLRQLDAL